MRKIAHVRIRERLALLRSGVILSEIARQEGVSLPGVTVSMQRACRDEFVQAMIEGLRIRLERLRSSPAAFKRLASHAHDRYPDVFPSVRVVRPAKDRHTSSVDIRTVAAIPHSDADTGVE